MILSARPLMRMCDACVIEFEAAGMLACEDECIDENQSQYKL